MSLLVGGGDPCPCGSGATWSDCCRDVVTGGSHAATAEALLRSRYCAFVVGAEDHLWRTWHPRTRPDRVTTDARVRWSGLSVLATEAGGPDDDEGTVHFAARLRTGQGPDVLEERSRFLRRGGRWTYVDGDRLA